MIITRIERPTIPNTKGRIFRTIALLTAMIVLVDFHLAPALRAADELTVEEAAGKRDKKTASKYIDEFGGKAPERRDSGSGLQVKDPRLACMLSLIVPGGGHVYLRQDLKGISFCLLTGVGYGASAYYLYLALFGGASGTEAQSDLIVAALLFVVAAIVHIVGVVEAYNDAVDINEKKFYYGQALSESPYVAKFEYKE
jgi:hypothetical protein